MNNEQLYSWLVSICSGCCTTNQNRSFSPNGLYFHNRRRATALPAVVQRTKLHLKGGTFLALFCLSGRFVVVLFCRRQRCCSPAVMKIRLFKPFLAVQRTLQIGVSEVTIKKRLSKVGSLFFIVMLDELLIIHC